MFPETIIFAGRKKPGGLSCAFRMAWALGWRPAERAREVVELLEQFLESGFSQETAAKMVNSALVMKGQDGMFSTVDICAVDLYTGICNFLKAGACATFIKGITGWKPSLLRVWQQG